MVLVRLLYSHDLDRTFPRWGWIWTGVSFASLGYFVLFKGLKNAAVLDAPIMETLQAHPGYLMLGLFLPFALLGLILVPVFASFNSIYVAHGAFTASITPPMVVAIVLGAFWKRYTPKAAFWTLTGGMALVGCSIAWPVLIFISYRLVLLALKKFEKKVTK